MCVSPVCVVYSTRLKEYGTVFLMTCAVLWVAESARRRPARARLVQLATVSVLAFVVSASMGPVIAGVWVALMLSAARERRLRRDEVVSAVVVAGGCGIVAAIFYGRISPSLSKFWANNYITHGSVSTFLRSLNGGLWAVYFNLLHLPTLNAGGVQLLLLLVILGLSVFGAAHNAAMLGPACIVVVAVCASVAHVAPLGTGRTDEYLYPALLLLLASGVVGLWDGLRDRVSAERRNVAGTVVAAVGVVVGAVVIVVAIATTAPYPGFAVQTLATEISRAPPNRPTTSWSENSRDTRGRTTRKTRSASASVRTGARTSPWSARTHACSSSPPRGTRAVRSRRAGPTNCAPTAGCGSWSPPRSH